MKNSLMSGKMWLLGVGGGIVLLAVLIGIAFLAIATRPTSQASPTALTQTFDQSPTGFTFRYPEGWEYVIPIQGLLVMGTPPTLYQSQPGPTFTVQRLDPVSVYGSLDEALDLYLRRGALRRDRAWSTLGEITAATLDSRAALQVEIQGKENDASPELRAQVIATTAQNTFVYILVLTAPSGDWTTHEPTLSAMLDTLQILE